MSTPTTHELESAPPLNTALTIDDKGEFDHVEDDEVDTKKPAAFIVDNYGELSKQHDLSFRATLVQFKKAMAICFGVGICAMGDGYQYKMPGNIVALPGFIRQMGYQNPEGKWMLDPQHVAAWGGESDFWRRSSFSGVYAASVVCILLVGSYPIDRFGRKPMLIATQVFMLIACLIEMWATNWTHWIAAKVLNVSHAYASADDRVFLWDVIR
jgi:SP family general alpha glucoside:H+ symporter-like MFS transporter